MTKTFSFNVWMTEVENYLNVRFGLGSEDLIDQNWHDWFSDGFSPKDAVDQALVDEGFVDSEE